MKRKNAIRVAAVTLVAGIMMSMPVSAGNSHKWQQVIVDTTKYKCTKCSNTHNVKKRYHECTKCGIEAYSIKASSKHLGVPTIDYRDYCGSCSG